MPWGRAVCRGLLQICSIIVNTVYDDPALQWTFDITSSLVRLMVVGVCEDRCVRGTFADVFPLCKQGL